jgi:hypothetical protein
LPRFWVEGRPAFYSQIKMGFFSPQAETCFPAVGGRNNLRYASSIVQRIGTEHLPGRNPFLCCTLNNLFSIIYQMSIWHQLCSRYDVG